MFLSWVTIFGSLNRDYLEWPLPCSAAHACTCTAGWALGLQCGPCLRCQAKSKRNQLCAKPLKKRVAMLARVGPTDALVLWDAIRLNLAARTPSG